MRALYLLIPLVGSAACGQIASLADAGGDSSGSDSVGDGSLGTKCSELPLTCGPRSTSSCCDSKVVSGGMFFRGLDHADSLYSDMAHSASISSFRLDTYEVTVGRFRQFVTAGNGTQVHPPAAGAGARKLNGATGQGGWDSTWNSMLTADSTSLAAALRCSAPYETWTDLPSDSDNRPITCVTWFEAMAFCIWDGGFLPTEAESMFAASGGSQQRAYAWSNPAASTTVNCSIANYGDDTWPKIACNAAGAMRVGAMSPAGDGAFGQADLGGNAIEWVFDWAWPWADGPCNDCANLSPARSERRLRGGGYQDAKGSMRAASAFNAYTPDYRDPETGFRCARPAP